MLDIVKLLQQAAEYIEKGTDLYEAIKPSIDNLTDARPVGLAEAQQRVQQAMDRAKAAHDDLDAAIKQRLGE